MLESAEFIHEKRLVNRLRMYWSYVRDEDILPDYRKFNQNYIADMWDNCLLFSVSYSGQATKLYQCEYIGQNLSVAFGNDLKDRYISSKDRLILPGANLMDYLDKSLNEKKFTMSSGQFVNYRDKIVKYRDCILPFADNNKNVSHLVAGISWREFD